MAKFEASTWDEVTEAFRSKGWPVMSACINHTGVNEVELLEWPLVSDEANV